jgi:hypothetical protein
MTKDVLDYFRYYLEYIEIFKKKMMQPWLKFKLASVLITFMSPTGGVMNLTMKKLANAITNLPTEWRVRALNTVANLLELKVIH